MTQNELAKAKDQDLISSVQAMKRAAALARQVAVQTGTAIVVSKDEKIIRRTAAELAAQSVASSSDGGSVQIGGESPALSPSD